MTLELLQHCTFTGPALPEPFVRFELEKELTKAKLLPKTTGNEGKELDEAWQVYRRKLREATRGGALRVRNHVITPLVKLLGYDRIESGGEVETREGLESGGEVLITADNSTKLRVWCTDFETDLDAPAKRGAAYRYSYLRIAQRVLLTCGERLGLLTNGVELRLLISDPARPDSQITIAIDPYWKRSRSIPDSFLLLLALVPPNGVKALPELVGKARLQQARVTKELRVQARRAVERFIQEILEQVSGVGVSGVGGLGVSEQVFGQMSGVRGEVSGTENLTPDTRHLTPALDTSSFAKQLWKEGLIIVYRLLFILKLESSDNPAQAFSFASTSLWRNTFSPSMALANYARKVLDDGWETGSFLENGLRSLFRLFSEGLSCTELNVKPLGGALFGADSTPILSNLKWGERAISHLLNQLLWTMPQAGKARERVHYGSLDVEDLGRVYEALLELEPGITTEPMCRLRRQKLEVVVPVAQGEKYRKQVPGVRDQVSGVEVEELGKNAGGQKLSGSESLESGDGYGSRVLSTDETVSDNRNLRIEQPDSKSSSISSSKHRRGKREGSSGSIHPSSINSERISDGIRDTSIDSGETFVPNTSRTGGNSDNNSGSGSDAEWFEEDTEGTDEEDNLTPNTRNRKPDKVDWIEEIPPGRFYLRVGLGRKASGSYYTPHSFVRFLVKETLEPQINEKSPKDDPKPVEILKLKVLDPAMGSGHFLVEACRFLGDKLYEACRLCDELATEAEKQAEEVSGVRFQVSEEVSGVRFQVSGIRNNRGLETENLTPDTQYLTPDSYLQKARELRQRIIDLPDPDDKLLKYLPSSAPEKEETGYSQTEAIALCRRLVAVHCLYGVDKNPLAVELAKLSLWLESHGEGLPLTFLDHRLVVGDSLTGPFFEHLLKEPGSQDDVQKLIWQGVNQQFRNGINEALKHVRDLEATIGVNISEIQAKEAAKARLDRALAPFKIVAAAWAGGVMLGKDKCDDIAYSQLVQMVGKTGDLPEQVSGVGFQVSESSDVEQLNPEKSKLLAMIARGLGVESVPSKREDLLAVLVSGECVPALSYDLTFAEVFYPSGNLENRQGFDAVLGNPPWDRINVAEKEFWAQYDLNVLDSPTKAAREEAQKNAATPERLVLWTRLEELYEEEYRTRILLYKAQSKDTDGKATRGSPDMWKLFTERTFQLQNKGGYLGIVVPSSFHANEGATGIRNLMIKNGKLLICYSFQNEGKKFFEIDPRFKFDCIIAGGTNRQETIFTRFYLHDDNWLFLIDREERSLIYRYEFIRKTGGAYLSFIELTSQKDADVADTVYSSGITLHNWRNKNKIIIKQELNITRDEYRFEHIDKILSQKEDSRKPEILQQLISKGFFTLDDDKTFHQFTDFWYRWQPRYLIHISKLMDRPDILQACQHYRVAVRNTTGGRNERTGIFTLLPPGHAATHKAPTERQPQERSTYKALVFLSLVNSFSFDWLLRLKVQTDMNMFMLDSCAVPHQLPNLFLSYSALRLTCNHAGYLPLWQEQLGNEWREPNKEPFAFPVLATDDERWQIRAAIDAVVADAYGLNREQYAHILSTFSHKSYPKAPQLCLACFDELQNMGLEAFTQKYDPYWDIPLNENLPKPVIELPIPEANTNAISTDDGTFQLTAPPTEKPKSRRKKK